jgi:hypothetical protein
MIGGDEDWRELQPYRVDWRGREKSNLLPGGVFSTTYSAGFLTLY